MYVSSLLAGDVTALLRSSFSSCGIRCSRFLGRQESLAKLLDALQFLLKLFACFAFLVKLLCQLTNQYSGCGARGNRSLAKPSVHKVC
jgi:hypothetical protein